MDLSRETRATATHAATSRREACWRQSGKSKVLDCHRGDCPFSLFLGLYRARVRSPSQIFPRENLTVIATAEQLEAPLPAFPSMSALREEHRLPVCPRIEFGFDPPIRTNGESITGHSHASVPSGLQDNNVSMQGHYYASRIENISLSSKHNDSRYLFFLFLASALPT